MTDWPYSVERPGRGQVRACPRCGCVAVIDYWHEDGGKVQTVVMNANRAAHLRRTSGLYEPMTFECGRCGYSGPLEEGMTVNIGHPQFLCATCSGRSERQVRSARRAVAVTG